MNSGTDLQPQWEQYSASVLLCQCISRPIFPKCHLPTSASGKWKEMQVPGTKVQVLWLKLNFSILLIRIYEHILKLFSE